MTFNKKFSFTELTSNANDKTSASGVAGLLIVCISSLMFIYGCLVNVTDIISNSVFLVTVGAGLLGLKK